MKLNRKICCPYNILSSYPSTSIEYSLLNLSIPSEYIYFFSIGHLYLIYRNFCFLLFKIYLILILLRASLVAQTKASAYNAGDPGKIPWRRKWQLTPVFLLGKSYGLRILEDYSPWGREESDMTEQLHFTFNLIKGTSQGMQLSGFHLPIQETQDM